MKQPATEELRKRIEEGFFMQQVQPKMFNMFDLEWDVLFLIDACRYDLFRDSPMLPGKLERKISVASCTPEWAKKSFADHDLSSIIYISANPFISRSYLSREQINHNFFLLEELWDTQWNDRLKTVTPDVVTRNALQLHQKHPEKKLFVHYIQPHHPFIGDHAIQESGWEASRNKMRGDASSVAGELNVYEKLQQGLVTRDTVWSAYRGNLELVLREIQNNLGNFSGKKIISSDHGDCFGEYGLYAHPEGTYIPELIEVPWFEIKE